MGGAPSNVTSTTTASLPAFAAPYANSVLNDVSNYVNADLAGGFPRGLLEQVAPLTGLQQQGINLGQNAATGSQALLVPALQQMEATLSGNYLNPQSNPYLSATYNEAAQPIVQQYRDAIAPGIQAEFAHAGSFGGSAQQQTEGLAQQGLANALGNLATNLYGGAYEQGLQNQIKEQSLLPSLLAASFTPSQALLNLGGLSQQQQQSQLNAALQNAQSEFNYPYQTLSQLASAIPVSVGGAYNATTTGPNPNALSPLAGSLAGSLGGYGLASLIGGSLLGGAAGPLGAGLGGLAGLLSSLL